MFERRLKVFLGVLLLFTLVLVLRAAQVQVVQHEDWDRQAADMRKRTDRMETTRGRILDFWGRAVAVDVPCVDASVDYRALTPQPDARWVGGVAAARLADRLGSAYAQAPRDRRRALLAEEVKQVRADIEQMWPRLAKIASRPPEEIEEVRRSIVEKVKMRRRYVWYHNYERAMRDRRDESLAASTQPASVWRKWLLDDSDDAPDVDSFEVSVSEETEKHVVLRDVDDEVQVELGKYADRFPGLELRPSTRRDYPFGEAAAHVIGRLGKVTREDMKRDPKFGDELRQYEPNDLIGRGGVEGLAEQVLRGTRGRIDKVEGKEVGAQNPVPGRDVQLSIDVELQHDVQALFKAVPIITKTNENPEGIPEKVPMHGAAVVIDVKTGELRVLASAPTFDLNRYDEDYARLSDPNDLNRPLLNRATQALREPGSTVKPLVGLAAAASGLRSPADPYECTGYMVVNGRYFNQGRCWVNSMFHDDLCKPDCKLLPCPNVAHHRVPYLKEFPNGIAALTLRDALERSCNPYFESIANGLGPQALSDWYLKFGIGRKTYLGIAEAKGRVPTTGGGVRGAVSGMFSTWMAGIGQGPVQATPVQMANAVATVARDGVWVRPTLLKGDRQGVAPTTQEADRVDLGLPPEAVKAVKDGMVRVVNGRAGSGGAARRDDMTVAGKTGSATASPVVVDLYDPATGQGVLDEKGKPKKALLQPSTLANPNPAAPWYRGTGRDGTDLTHAWFIGFAPAEEPQIAFAVMVEYGGAGGAAATTLTKQVIDLCVRHRHLTVPGTAPKQPQGVAGAGAELLRPVPALTQANN